MTTPYDKRKKVWHMAFPLVLVIGVVFFCIQLLLCFKSRRKWIRLAPTAMVCVAEAVGWAVYFLTRDSDLHLVLSVYILAVIGLVWLTALVFAWSIYALVKYIQKRRN